MTVSYERTPQHWAEANIAYFENTELGKKRLRHMRWIVGVFAALVSVGIFLAFSMLVEAPLLLRILGTTGCLAVAFAMARYLTPGMARSEINKIVRKIFRKGNNSDVLGKKTLTLEEEGVRVRGETAESLLFWKSINDVLVTEKYILICIGENQFMELSKEVFADSQHQADFLAIIERFRQGQAPQAQAWYQSKDQVG